MMDAHTKTPWRNACFQVYGSDNSRIAHTGMGQLPPSRSSESEANAAFIVKAVNAHDNLVKALERALQQWKMYAEMTEQGEFDIETDVSFEGDAFRECRAILTSIKES